MSAIGGKADIVGFRNFAKILRGLFCAAPAGSKIYMQICEGVSRFGLGLDLGVPVANDRFVISVVVHTFGYIIRLDALARSPSIVL